MDACDRTQQPRLTLTALAQQHHVVPGDEGTLQLRDHGVLEAQDARPRIASLGERGQQIFPDFCLDASFAMAGRLQLANGPGQFVGLGHYSTLRLLSSSRPSDSNPRRAIGGRLDKTCVYRTAAPRRLLPLDGNHRSDCLFDRGGLYERASDTLADRW